MNLQLTGSVRCYLCGYSNWGPEMIEDGRDESGPLLRCMWHPDECFERWMGKHNVVPYSTVERIDIDGERAGEVYKAWDESEYWAQDGSSAIGRFSTRYQAYRAVLAYHKSRSEDE